MRRGALLLTTVALLLVMSAGVSLAATLFGTDGFDTLDGTGANDLLRGGDALSGGGGRDSISGDRGRMPSTAAPVAINCMRTTA